MRLALIAGVAVGLSAPMIGAFLVQKRLSLLGDGIGHLAFAGVGAGVLFGIWPVWTALAAATGGAVAVEWLRSRGRAPGDLALALLFYSGIAGGVVLLGAAHRLDATLLSYLFGSVLTVSPSDAMVVVVLGAVVVGIMGVLERAMFAVVLDEEAARVAGLPVGPLTTVLAGLAAVT